MEPAFIEVETSHPAFGYVYALFKTTIEIDDRIEKRPWGVHRFEVAPGEHTVAVSYPWVFNSRCGRSTATVTAHPGHTTRVTYSVGMIRYVPGTMRVEPQIPTATIVRR